MYRKTTPMILEEIGNTHFTTIRDAQEQALTPIATAMTSTLCDLLAAGLLIHRDGKVMYKSKE